MENLTTITENIEVLKWFYSEEKELTEDEKSSIFVTLSLAYAEDAHAFLRVFKYMTNKRKGSLQEQRYRVIIHFLSVMIPNIVMANLEDFIQLGYKNDVIYYAMTPSLTKHILKYVNHKARMDKDFKSLIDTGKMMNVSNPPSIDFDLIDNDYVKLMENILDEPAFNNIMY